jgi:hypothetical protein
MESLEKYIGGQKLQHSPDNSSVGKVIDSVRRDQDIISDHLEDKSKKMNQIDSNGYLES